VEEMVETLVWDQMVCHDMEFYAKDVTNPTFTIRRTIAKDVVLYQKYLNKLRLITRMETKETITEKTFGLCAAIAID
jgi:hypothetical protein